MVTQNIISGPAVVARLNLLRQRVWPKNEISKLFGINLAEIDSLMRPFQMWDEMNTEGALNNSQKVDRWKFEVFLSARSWSTRREAALQLAVADDCFTQIVSKSKEKNLITSTEAEGVLPGVYRSELFSAFYKRFPVLRTKIFPSLSVYFYQLHAEISRFLGFTVTPLKCPTAAALGEGDYATSFDALALEPMSIRFQVFLDTPKPLQLPPDSCSWLTYIRFEQELGGAVLGRKPEISDLQRQKLLNYGTNV